MALFSIHVILLLFPPIPPDIKGSLWSWLAGYGSIALLLVELARQRRRLAEGWARLEPGARWLIGLGPSAEVLILALILRWFVTPVYLRFSAEAGVWEPLTLFCYLGSAVILFGVAGGVGGDERRHWGFVAGLYALLGLEEVDYFGIFGGLVGRIDGIYVGSLHDLVMLAAEGALSAGTWALIGVAFVLVIVALTLSGYLQPRALAAMVAARDFLWIALGLGFLLAAAAVEAEIFAWTAGALTLEEVLELAGAIPFFFYALSLSATIQQASAGLSRAGTE